MIYQSDRVSIRFIQGSRTLNNICLTVILFSASLGFLFTGISSYFGEKTIVLINSASNILAFIPQGLVMCFYGIAGLFVSLYLLLTILFNVGSGYNEFDQQSGLISVFRWGFPGSNRKIRVQCLVSDIECILIKPNSGFNITPVLALQLKGGSNLPLHSRSEALKLEDLEQEAAKLAQFLQVPLNNQL